MSRSTKPEIFMPLSLSVLSQSGPPKSVGSKEGRESYTTVHEFMWTISVAKRKTCLAARKDTGIDQSLFSVQCLIVVLKKCKGVIIRAIMIKGD